MTPHISEELSSRYRLASFRDHGQHDAAPRSPKDEDEEEDEEDEEEENRTDEPPVVREPDED